MNAERIVFVLLAAVLACQPSPPPPASGIQPTAGDLLLTNGRIFTAALDAPWAEAVVIRGGTFAFVGGNAAARRFAADTAVVHDLEGRFAMPGIIDSHTHPGLVSMLGPGDPEPLIPTTSREDILAWLRDYSRSHWYSPVIIANAWPVSLFGTTGPHKKDLDEVVSLRPVLLFDDSGHSFWMNSSMLWLLGVDEETPDPAPGLSQFVRDADGQLTGWAKEFAIIPFAGDSLLAGDGEREEALTRFLDFLASRGVTTLYDAGNLLSHDAVYRLIAKLERAGRLPLRYEGTYHIMFPDQLPKAVSEMTRLRSEYGGELLRFNTVKIHFDGVAEIRTAAYLDPYHDDPGNRGATLLSREVLTEFMLELEEAQLDLHLHAIGDRATRAALDAFEAARREAGGAMRLRLTLSHLEYVDEEDLPRFAEMGVIANFTPHWLGNYFQGAAPGLGEQRWNQRERARTLQEHGALLTFSSDVTGYAEMLRADPFYGIQVGHNRQDIGEEDGPIRPPADERLALDTLLRGYTANGAYQLRMEDVAGSIEIGKHADMVILDLNPFEVDRSAIHEVQPTAVLLGGRVTFGDLR